MTIEQKLNKELLFFGCKYLVNIYSYFIVFYFTRYSMKFKRLLVLLVFFALPSFAAYQQQGFTQFQELDGNVNFSCTDQCFVLVGPLVGSDYVSLNGMLQWNGMVGYGFVVGQQIIPGETFQINGATAVDQQFSFSKFPMYSQIPQDAQIVVIVQGNVVGSQMHVALGFMDFYQKIGKGWKDFRQMETLTPYSINLRYWVKILWTSIVQYWYWIFLLVALYILFFVKWGKDKKFRKIFFLGIGIFLFIGIRNLITYTWIVDQGIKSYTNQSLDNKTFFDLWDYITFTDKIRKELQLDTKNQKCKIYVDSFQDRPFKVHRENLYLKPCVVVMTWSDADYSIYYKKAVSSWDLQKNVLVNFHWSYLLQNK